MTNRRRWKRWGIGAALLVAVAVVVPLALSDDVSRSDWQDRPGSAARSDRPLDPEAAQQVTAPTLTFIGTEDRIPVSEVEAMHAAFDEAGLENEFVVYEGAQHAFFNDTRPSSYSAEASADAWPKTLIWFREHLGSTT